MKKECFQCLKPINTDKDKWVLVGTYNAGNTEEETYFHFTCWLEHFNQAVIKRIQVGQGVAMNILQDALKGVMPQLKEIR